MKAFNHRAGISRGKEGRGKGEAVSLQMEVDGGRLFQTARAAREMVAHRQL